MRKGFTLVEMLVIVIIVPVLFIFLDGLFRTLLADIPRSHRIAQESITLHHLLEQIQEDMDNAEGLPQSVEGFSVNDKQFLIDRPEGVISYQQENDRIVRRQLTGGEKVWSLPHTKVAWKIWEKNSQGYAVEVSAHFEYKTCGKWKKTLANSHLFYGGAIR
ncbi:MAG: type II secretion system protein [Sedimentisphaerales bacterium]|nr:type II secretion system protein [Sedimentisphaerales bacterium]